MKKLILTLTIFGLVLAPLAVRAETEISGVASVKLTDLPAQVKAGESLTLTLIAEDAEGKTQNVSENALFQVNDPRGTIEKNIYLPGRAGTWKITASYGNYSSEAEIKVIPGAVSRIEINPNSQPEIINLDEKKTFTASAFDSMDNAVEEAVFTWSQEGNLGNIDKEGVFEAKARGSGHVIASSGDVSGKVAIEVREKIILEEPAAETEENAETPAQPITEEEPVEEETEEEIIADPEGESEKAEEEESKALAWYWWVLIMLAYLAVLIFYYSLVKKSKSGWWWLFPLVLTVAVLWIYFQYSGDAHGWWPWVAIILGLFVTLFRPKKFFEEPKEPTF